MRRGDFSADSRMISLAAISSGIGVVAAIAALALVKLILFFTNLFFYGTFSVSPSNPALNHLGYWVVLIPVLGGIIIGFMARFGSERIRGHGIPEALEAILYGKSIMQPKVAVLKPVSSAISIGSGGPFGAEGPIIMTGGAMGSLIAQLFHLTASERKTLLVAGASAGMSAIFSTPVAAVLLAVELLLFEWKPRSLIPVAIASITASAMRPFLLGKGPVFPFLTHFELTTSALLIFAVSGIFAGLFAAGVSRLLYGLEDFFRKLPIHWMWWPALGGVVVGLGGYFQPHALGIGYDVIEKLLKGELPASSALPLIAVKSIIWVVSLASGTSGGVLAPLLMMGCGLGVVETVIFPGTFSVLYPIASMAAVMGGIMRAPFTAVVFCLELTHDADSLLPVLTATVFSYAMTVVLMKRSILTEKVARRGLEIFQEYHVDPLEMTKVSDVMTKDVIALSSKILVKELLSKYFDGRQKHRGYPVVDELGRLKGVITVSNVLNFRNGQVECSVGDLMSSKPVVAYPDESCRDAADRMAKFQVGRLPVVSPLDHSILGMLTRSDLLKPCLSHHESEVKRERILQFKKQIASK